MHRAPKTSLLPYSLLASVTLALSMLSACTPTAQEKEGANAGSTDPSASPASNGKFQQGSPEAPPTSSLGSCEPLLKEFQLAETVRLDSALDLPWYKAGYPSDSLFVSDLLDLDHDGRKDIISIGELKDGSDPPFSIIVLANLSPEVAPGAAPGAADAARAIIAKEGEARKVGLAFLHLNHRFSGIPDDTVRLFGNTLAEVGTYQGDAVLRVRIAVVPGAPHNSPTGFQALMRLLPDSSAQLLCLTASNTQQ